MVTCDSNTHVNTDIYFKSEYELDRFLETVYSVEKESTNIENYEKKEDTLDTIDTIDTIGKENTKNEISHRFQLSLTVAKTIYIISCISLGISLIK